MVTQSQILAHRSDIFLRNTRYASQDAEPAPWDVLYTIPSGLYNCQESSTNQPFLCKTNPISEKPKLTHTLFYKGLMKIFAYSATQKTNPKQSQTKPISKNAKMNITSVKTRNYENKSLWKAKKNKAKSNPIFAKGKNEHKFSLHKGL